MVDDAVTVAPNEYKTIFENDRGRLLEYRGGPGAKTAMHSHPDVIAYGMTSGKVRFTLPGGQSFEAELNAGEAMDVAGQNHATENVGDSELRVLLVELK